LKRPHVWLKNLFVIVAVILVALCSQIESAETLWNYPQAEPEFILAYNNISISESGLPIPQPMICIEFYEAPLVELDDTPDKIEQDIKSTTSIEVDEKILSAGSFLVFSNALDLMAKYDANDNYLGSYTNGLTACFSTNTLSKGFHKSKIEFGRASGKTYSFSWAFKVS
jgi:hypothetical protein